MANSFVTIVIKLFLFILFTETIHGAEDRYFWEDIGHMEIIDSLKYKWNTNVAKNVIIFIGDGMSFETIIASRIYNGGEESHLAWEKFPHIGLLKTYDSDKQVPDSASTATALFSGVKTNYKVAGVDANVQYLDCEASLKKKNQLESIINWGQDAGKDTGFVTTSRVTHATPAALYAHIANRDWECEQMIPRNAAKCKDIARQLVEDEPGKNIKVIMGGGRQMLESNTISSDDDPVSTEDCYSQDGRSLIKDWADDKARRNFSHTVVQNNEELFKVDPKKTDFLLGIFSNSYITMDWERNRGPEGQPSLENMTTTAIKILQKSEKGFVLVVEGGLIDTAHHRGYAAQALQETVRLSQAIEATLKLVDTDETLIIVTSDHGHSLTFQGISKRGANILGIAEKSKYDEIPYTTLGYTTGSINNMAYEIYNHSTVVRRDPSQEDTTAFTYSQPALIISDMGKHSGVDVAVYAIGPYAHLFHTTHEQSFVAHATAFAARMGKYYSSSASSVTVCSLALLMVGLQFLCR